MKRLSRRRFVVAGLGLAVTGCAQMQQRMTQRPRPKWPHAPLHPRANGQAMIVPSPIEPSGQPLGPIVAIPREQWATSKPISGRLQPMHSIRRITVHHEGWTPVWFDDTRATSQRLESIRSSHLQRLHAGDIGYHLVIDRAGRIWQGRNLQYQGAHVRDHNEMNVGVMVLGNFDLQKPTDPQITSLRNVLAGLMRQYHIPIGAVFTHQELNVTSCPGKTLQRGVTWLRENNRLV